MNPVAALTERNISVALTTEQIQENYAKFKSLLTPHVSEELMEYINESDFATSPASSRDDFHGAYEGGLVEHSLGVLRYLKMLNGIVRNMYTDEQIIRTALLHDLCKAGCYHQAPAWRKDSRGKWEKYTKWVFKDPYPIGHGSKSVTLILSHGTQLTPEETMAIMHHMGAYGLQGTELSTYTQATKDCPLVLLAGWADLCEANIEQFMLKRKEFLAQMPNEAE